jgi:hypothetical protein
MMRSVPSGCDNGPHRGLVDNVHLLDLTELIFQTSLIDAVLINPQDTVYLKASRLPDYLKWSWVGRG